jgi:membrane protein YdbS with pleckstrin-like domain
MDDLTPLAPRARTLFYAEALLGFVVARIPLSLGAAALGGWAAWPWGLLAGAVLLFLSFVELVWWPSLAWESWGWAVRDGDVLIARGVVGRRVTAIPTQRIQHVDLRQGVVERWMGLARVVVSTASGAPDEGTVPGLDLADARALRDRLVRVRGDAGV